MALTLDQAKAIHSEYKESLAAYEDAFTDRYIEERDAGHDHELAKFKAEAGCRSLLDDVRDKALRLEHARIDAAFTNVETWALDLLTQGYKAYALPAGGENESEASEASTS